MEMEWDWENVVAFGSKAIESPKKLQLADWMIVDDGDIHGGSFNQSVAAAGGGGGNSGASGSDGRHGSISASTDSSCKDGMQTSIFRFTTSEGSCGNMSKKIEMKGAEVSGSSVGSVEALLGLKLGKRTYFENCSGGGGVNSAMPSPPPTTVKKSRSSAQNAPIYCQVEACNVDLSLAKEYHRKHRVCDSHSKCPKVVVGGRERRFCQQCSRFHSLSEFDEKKRSCRRRLSDHNARRRKPQQETIQFNSPTLSTPFYGGSQSMNFVLNNPLIVHPANNSPKFTVTKGCSFKCNGGDQQLRMPGNGATPEPVVLNPGMVSSLDEAPEYGRALSLLSTSWTSCDHHSTSQGVAFSSSELWPATQHHVQPLPTFKTPYDADLYYSNLLN